MSGTEIEAGYQRERLSATAHTCLSARGSWSVDCPEGSVSLHVGVWMVTGRHCSNGVHSAANRSVERCMCDRWLFCSAPHPRASCGRAGTSILAVYSRSLGVMEEEENGLLRRRRRIRRRWMRMMMMTMMRRRMGGDGWMDG
eukprot:2712648-Rhodomonas_salina.1